MWSCDQETSVRACVCINVFLNTIGCVGQVPGLWKYYRVVIRIAMLICFQARYDIDHALVLAQMHHFKAGILYLYEKAKLWVRGVKK